MNYFLQLRRNFIVIFLVVTSPLAFGAASSGCIDGKIKFIDNGKEIIKEDRYCYDSLLHSLSSAKKCPNNKECIINLAELFPVEKKTPKSLKKPLGFDLCVNLNGVPQFIEFWNGESWIKTTRCLFPDSSYIDLVALGLKVKKKS